MNGIEMMIDYYMGQLKAMEAIEKGNWRLDLKTLNIVAFSKKEKKI